MTIRVTNLSQNKTEQIKNGKPSSKEVSGISFDLDTAQLIYNGVKTILEKDKFNIFSTKSKIVYKKKIDKISKVIDNLIKINVKGKNGIKLLKNDLQKLKSQNLSTVEDLKEKLR